MERILRSGREQIKMADYLHIPAAVHVHTTRSGGAMSAEQLGLAARESGVKAVILTDKLRADWHVGVKPFEGILKVKVPGEHVSPGEIEEYVADVNAADAMFDDVLIMPGFEVAPSFRWSGSPGKGDLKLLDWNKELLAFGMKEPQDWAGIPAAAGWTENSLATTAWPELLATAALAAAGAVLFLKKKKKEMCFGAGCGRKIKIARATRPHRALGACVFAAAVLLFAASYPFTRQNRGENPEEAAAGRRQSIINHVESAEGIVAWAHPEAQWERRVRSKDTRAGALLSKAAANMNFTAVAYAEPHQEMLLETSGFTAFAALNEGYEKTARPGGLWDAALADYSAGDREKPFWALGEVDFYGNEARKRLDSVLTVVLAESFTSDSVIAAINAGRMYVTTTAPGGSLRMPEFFASGAGNETAVSGETLISDGRVLVSAVIDSVPARGAQVSASVIRNGEVAKVFRGAAPLRIVYEAEPVPGADAEYFRVEAEGSRGMRLISNPIFISRQSRTIQKETE